MYKGTSFLSGHVSVCARHRMKGESALGRGPPRALDRHALRGLAAARSPAGWRVSGRSPRLGLRGEGGGEWRAGCPGKRGDLGAHPAAFGGQPPDSDRCREECHFLAVHDEHVLCSLTTATQEAQAGVP